MEILKKSTSQFLILFLFAAFFSGLSFQLAQAGSLREYKEQKHSEPPPPSPSQGKTKVPCNEALIAECLKNCSSNDESCSSQCTSKAQNACRQLASDRAASQLTMLAHVAMVFLPAIGTIFDNPRYIAQKDFDGQDSYELFWNYPSFSVDLGGGYLQQGAKAVSATAQYRYDFFGFGGTAAYLTDGTDNLAETDFGPMLYVGSEHISAGFQFSAVGSAGSGMSSKWGFGLRSLNTINFSRFYITWNPLVGLINSQWLFHLRAGLGFRFTPSIGLSLAYEHRSLIDLRSLNLGGTSLPGVFLYLTYRIN